MPRVRRRRHRFVRHHALLWALGGLSVAFLLAGVVVGYITYRLGQVDRLEVAEQLTAADQQPVSAGDVVVSAPIGSTVPAETFDDFEIHRPGRPAENYLIVGSDSVEGLDANDDILYLREEESENHLADTVMVMRLRPDGTAAVLSIPRDLIVEIADAGFTHKINTAYNLPDPEDRAARLINTVEENLGIELQHFVEINLAGFRELVDAVGGVQVCFPRATRDRTTFDSGDPLAGGTGFEVSAGVHRLGGDQALQYVRSRHLLVQDEFGVFQREGYWTDLERNVRQQEFLVSAIDQTFASAVSNPTTLRRILDIFAEHIATSDTLSVFDDGFDLARVFRNFDSGKLERYTFEVADGTLAGVTGLVLRDSVHNERLLDVFRGIGWDDVVAERVDLVVAGAQTPRAAAMTAFAGRGFAVRSGTSAEVDRTTLRYGIGGERAAALVLSLLPAGVETVGDPGLVGNIVHLHLGSLGVQVLDDHRPVELPDAVAPTTSAPATSAPADAAEPPTSVASPSTTTVAPAPTEPVNPCDTDHGDAVVAAGERR